MLKINSNVKKALFVFRFPFIAMALLNVQMKVTKKTVQIVFVIRLVHIIHFIIEELESVIANLMLKVQKDVIDANQGVLILAKMDALNVIVWVYRMNVMRNESMIRVKKQ